MNRHRLALHSGVKGVDDRFDDPTGPYYLAEDVHQLLRRVQQQRFHTTHCRCWDCEALQKDIAATLGESPAPETSVAIIPALPISAEDEAIVESAVARRADECMAKVRQHFDERRGGEK